MVSPKSNFRLVVNVMLKGIVTDKLNITKKLQPDTAALLKATFSEHDFEKREEVFVKLRPELNKLFR